MYMYAEDKPKRLMTFCCTTSLETALATSFSFALLTLCSISSLPKTVSSVTSLYIFASRLKKSASPYREHSRIIPFVFLPPTDWPSMGS